MTSQPASIAWKPAVWLLAGDLVMILLFTAAGSREHHYGFTLYQTFFTALPFLLAWIAAGFVMGAFRPKAYSGFGAGAAAAALSWVVALPFGLVLRRFMYGKPIFTIYGVLALFFVYLFLMLWRSLFITLRRRRKTAP
ncbi:DUF3054 domain-containing protein [Paenibacillus aurantius]|uniref:DUF3054 domain-containing protein n=1 Tax=Paenibacillus aurantius TaxID=2918900 RepID=A0AA96RDU4_9BACL|nr:DUF3054 domain-containing protein [Paenibacillus aurantius]WNQ09806.1 DUF3054 domain-containing protein [Paenibacillus aurantius]